MKVFKVGVKVAVLCIVIFVLGLWFISIKTKPKYDGELTLNSISEKVVVFYDEYGVPHIEASNNVDAYIAFGYVHAQDRLWQMELIRRIAAGRLSEMFGKDLVEIDKFMSGLGIEENAATVVANLNVNSPSYKFATAYLNGINQYIEAGKTPIEFHVLGIEKEKYTLKDIYNVFGYMSFSFAMAHKTDPLLNEIKEKLGDDYLNEFIGAKTNTTMIKNNHHKTIEANFPMAIHRIMERLPVPSFIGSNSWVLGPEKTKNNKVIFANDPHINFGQPSVWYQSHIKTPDYEMYGFNLALVPFPLLGHNKTYAYGLTMFENDDIDFYIEQNNPENPKEYKTPDGYKTYELIDKSIKVKGEETITYQIKVSRHGPIMNDLIKQVVDERPIAMQWIYTKLPNNMLEASYEMSHAKSLNDFKKGISKIHAPGLNVMYGDAQDNIAWFASAKLYKYRDSLNTKIYLDGSSGNDEIITYLNFDENPQAVNPDWYYVYSANNQPDAMATGLYPGYYLPEDRAKRITNLLKDKHDFTKQDVAKMLSDVKSSTVSELCIKISESIISKDLSEEEKEVVVMLKNWDGSYLKDNIAPTIYNRFIYELMKNTYRDEMGTRGFHIFMEGSALQKKMIAKQICREKSVWWDDIHTEQKVETKKDIITKSMKKTVSFLKNQLGKDITSWQWKRVASVEHEHPLGKAGGVLRKIFNVGPFEVNGGNEVINNHIFKLDSTGYYKITAGPSSRRVIDFSDVENSLGIIPTGQSGNRFSPYYKDEAKKYLDGDFIKMKLNGKEIEESANKLVFMPNN